MNRNAQNNNGNGNPQNANNNNRRGGRGAHAPRRVLPGPNGAAVPIGPGAIRQAVNRYHATNAYNEGKKGLFQDMAALNRFNAWVAANLADIDPSAQTVCHECGDAALRLCAHKVAQPMPVQAPAVVAARARHHGWRLFGLRELITKAFLKPVFDTHDTADEALHGMSNDFLDHDALIIPELFSYCVTHQQTNYLVNGKFQRELKLAHTHRLAERWVVENKQQDQVKDLHYSARLRFTVQRATDSMQNNMLYKERIPALNFVQAWLPKSRGAQLRLAVALLLSCLIIGVVLISALSYLGVTVVGDLWQQRPFLLRRPSGKGLQFLCRLQDGSLRLPGTDVGAFSQTRYCGFTDSVEVLKNEALFQCWEALSRLVQPLTRSVETIRRPAADRLTEERFYEPLRAELWWWDLWRTDLPTWLVDWLGWHPLSMEDWRQGLRDRITCSIFRC